MRKLASLTALLTLGIAGAFALAQNQPAPGGTNPAGGAAPGAGGQGAATQGAGGQGAARGRGRGRGNQDPDMVFTRPTDSPGLGKAMELPKPGADGFSSMFNGKDLTGWDAL